MSSWTPEMDATIIAHRGKINYTEIGAMFGLSRSAISGRVGRLGLEKLQPSYALGTKHVRRKRTSNNAPDKPAPVMPVAPLNIPFIDRAHGQCAFPTSGSGYLMLCCGHQTADGNSYCGWCYSVAHTRPERKSKFYYWDNAA